MTVMLLNDNTLLTAFLNIASLLNHHFQITPVLYGSLGLSLRLGKNLSPDDIDILVPNAYMTTQWPDLLTVMENCGYRLENLQEHQFVKDYHKLSFADNDLANYVGIVWEQIPMLHDSDVTFNIRTILDSLSKIVDR